MASQERRERMWDAVYAQVFARVWKEPTGLGDRDLTVDQYDRFAAQAADEALARLDRTDRGWGFGPKPQPTET